MNAFFDLIQDQRRAIVFVLAVLGIQGIAGGFHLPLAIFPEVTFPRIKVIAESGELPADEMLRSVTRPLEQSVHRVPGIREMRSTTSRGSVEINLDSRWGSNMDLALQRVQGQIAAVREQLPPGTAVDARLMNPVLFPVLGLSIVARSESPAELRDLAVYRIQPELARLPGVAEVVVQGGRRLEARVALDPAALEARGLDAAGVARVIADATTLTPMGLLDSNRELYLCVADGRPPDLEALRGVAVPLGGGRSVPLGDLGTVTLEEAPEYVRFAAQSQEAVLINVMRQPSASTIEVSRGVSEWMRAHRKELPADLKIQTYYDQSDLVRSSVASVRDSLLLGGLMAIVIIALFLRSFSLGILGAVVLPVAIALSLLGFSLAGQSLNMMTLGGIAAAVGLVLDDAIVVVEALAHEGIAPGDRSRLSAVMTGLFPSLVGSSLCTISIFVPFILLTGVTGAFFRVLALSMTLMLGTSLLICSTLVPVLWRGRGRRRPPREPGTGSRRFRGTVAFVVRRPAVSLLALAVFLGAVPFLVRSLGSSFLPEMDEGALIMDYKTPPGTSVAETDRILRGVERTVDSIPDIDAWSRRTGEQLGFFITEPNTGDYVLHLRGGRRRSAEDVADALRGKLEASEPALEVEFGQLVEDVIGDLTSNPQPIEIRVYGEDRRLIERKVGEIANLLRTVPGVVDIVSGVVVSGSNLLMAPGPAAARAGLGVSELAEAVEPSIAGIDAGRISRGQRAWPVRVVLPRPEGMSAAARVAAVRVPAASGAWRPTGELASLRVQPGETEIDRDDQRTTASVTARLSGRDMGSAVGEIQKLVRRRLQLPAGMTVRYAGLWAEQQSSFRDLLRVLAAAVLGILLILVVAFRSWRQTGAVMLVALSALAGVFAALRVTGATLNIASFVGAIMVVGIVAENAYFLVAHHRSLLGDGSSRTEAAAGAAIRRARPVLMTTSAGVIALIPLAIGVGSGSALLQPLAVAVVGGFLVSAPLLLFVLPGLLALQ